MTARAAPQTGAYRHRGALAHRTQVQLARLAGRGYASGAVAATTGAPASVDGSLTLNAPRLGTMSDSQNITATPYPFYATGGNDDDSFRAALTSHASASVERNQDAQFASASRQALHRDVESTKRETAQAKYDLAVLSKDAEVRNADRFGEVRAELAALREKLDAGAIAQLRVELSESKAEARASKQESLLAAILAKLPV